MSSAVLLTQAVTSGDANAVSASLAAGADVNQRNNGGQTALILAVIFGHTHLVQLLVESGADPRLHDNLGLNAIEWAQRRGLTEALQILTRPRAAPARPMDRAAEPSKTAAEELPRAPSSRDTESQPITPDEKSRRWIAGLKQRMAEEARREPEEQPIFRAEPPPSPVVSPRPAPVLSESIEQIIPEAVAHESTATVERPLAERLPETRIPVPVTEVPPEIPRTSSGRKRCPKCNAIYNSDLVAYCAHHVVLLVDADDPVILSQPTTTTPPLLWIFVLVTVSVAAFTGYLIMSSLTRIVIPDSPSSAPSSQTETILKGLPVAGGDLAGKAVQLPEAVFALKGDERVAGTVNVHIKVDKMGKVYWARADGGDVALRSAATEAATKSTFAPERLRGRETEGTITYTFAP